MQCPECGAELEDMGDYLECDFCEERYDLDSNEDDPIPYEEDEDEDE